MSIRLWVCFCLLSFAFSEPLDSLKTISPDVRSLLNRSTRRLLAPSKTQGGWEVEDNGGRCRWDRKASSCAVTRAATVKHLRTSDSAYAKLVAIFGACAELKSKDTCIAQDCLWDGRTSSCSFADFRIGQEDSPCVKHMPATVASLVAGTSCPVYTTNLDCYQHSECEWDQEKLVCKDDGFQFYFGVTSSQFSEATAAVIEDKVKQMIPIFAQEFDTSVKGFDWKKVIDWKPASACPAWSDEMVSALLDGGFLDLGFYCGGKYPKADDIKACEKDPLCEYQVSKTKCVAPDGHYASGAVEGLKRMAKGIKSKEDRTYIETTLKCNTIANQKECTKQEACQWNLEKEDCDVHTSWIAELITRPGKDSSDAVCTLARAYIKSGCLDKTEFKGSEACNADPNCEARANGDCYGSPDYLLKYALDYDINLKSSYSLLQLSCVRYKRKRQCQRAPTYRLYAAY